MTSPRVPGGAVHALPKDLREALIANPAALGAWKDITPLARNEFICWVVDAKKEPTRERRIRRTRRSWRTGCGGPVAGQAVHIVRSLGAKQRLMAKATSRWFASKALLRTGVSTRGEADDGRVVRRVGEGNVRGENLVIRVHEDVRVTGPV